ncbi:MAG: DUF4416 family protein [Deltaproteobacteria bacterium]|nr:DUF4416 family protein [Deltaproteobacteria bacterium]MBW2015917.1 DUF4416 family protein [Deltaproteobacteria bacterium]MBW2127969.1 DUF4416 family protein [Deltaproteobacteria bacterium]MBW2303626.1 DUF4416 family protein [Deltaproteobacteria bacterium]
MSRPKEPERVKLIASLFSPQRDLLEQVLGDLRGLFGPEDWKSPDLYFDRTRYYEREMGWPLHRLFVSFERLVSPDSLVETKLWTNTLESRYLEGTRRRVNIDPGHLSLERLVLATGKNYTHRIYLSKGIYADLTLVFKRGSFRPLEWTYRDYAEPRIISYFNAVRERYKRQLRGIDENGAPLLNTPPSGGSLV